MACRLRIPLHVTGLWLPVRVPGDPLRSGSLGAGLLLEPGVEAVARPCSPLGGGGVRCGFRLEAPGSRGGVPGSVAELYRFDPGLPSLGRVEARSPAPIAVGYAVSAASALAAALGLGALGGRGLDGMAALAHAAEVEAGTGLGDVIAIYQGRMLVVRTAPGAPGLGRVESIPVDAGAVVAVEHGPPMETGEMHRALGLRLYSLAAPRLARLLEEPGLDRFLEEARVFSIEAGFAPGGELREALESMRRRGRLRGWYSKKRVTVVVPEEGWLEDVVSELRRLGLEPRVFSPAPAPASITCGRVRLGERWGEEGEEGG